MLQQKQWGQMFDQAQNQKNVWKPHKKALVLNAQCQKAKIE